MKIKTASSLLLVASLTSTAYAANLRLPDVLGKTANTTALGEWTPSDAGTDRGAFYSNYTIPGISTFYEGVSVGAYWDDYSGVGSSFTVSNATTALAVSGNQIDWRYSIAPTTGFTGSDRFDYSIGVKDSTNANIFTLTLVNDNTNNIYLAYVNGFQLSGGGVTFEDGNYGLEVLFGATTGYTVNIRGLDNSVISYTDSLYTTTGKTFGSIEIGTYGGPVSGAWNGDGIITVVPEPSAALLGALGVLGLFRRRR